jgi:DNA-binding NtrC family response regulator
VRAVGLEPVEVADERGFHSDVQDPGVLMAVIASGDDISWKKLTRAGQNARSDVGFILCAEEKDVELVIDALRIGAMDFMWLSNRDDEAAAAVERRLRRDASRARAKREIVESTSALRALVEDFVADLEEREQEPSEGVSTKTTAPCRVLLIEPAQTAAESAMEALREIEKIDPHRATTGAEALDLAKESDFDIFVLDHGLSDMQALDLMKQLSEISPDSETIFVVGFTAADDAVDALRWGAATFLIKPYPPEDLAARVRELRGRVERKKRSRRGVEEFRRNYRGIWDSYEEATARAQEPVD